MIKKEGSRDLWDITHCYQPTNQPHGSEEIGENMNCKKSEFNGEIRNRTYIHMI